MSDEAPIDSEELPHLLLVDDDETFTRVMARAMARRQGQRQSCQFLARALQDVQRQRVGIRAGGHGQRQPADGAPVLAVHEGTRQRPVAAAQLSKHGFGHGQRPESDDRGRGRCQHRRV